YNTIGLWEVTGTFGDRDKWRDAPAYVDGLKRPTQVLASFDKFLGAITRYVESKCLFGGVTTTQGIRLNGAASIGGFFRGLVRNAADFKLMGANGAKMVWSPLSNLLLYGKTADVKAARDNGVTIGLGSDWTFSGSKNLLGELKVARAANAIWNFGFSDRDIVA